MEEQGSVVEQSVPMVLLEFLYYGLDSNKEKNKKKLDYLQKLMADSNKANVIRICYYFDSGQKTSEEKKQWLIEKAKCKYFVFISENDTIDKGFVKDRLNYIKRFETAYDAFKGASINIKKQ